VRTSRASASGGASTTIHFIKAHTTCDSETGQVDILWPEDAEVLEGQLGKDLFASGATKEVYQVCSTFFPVYLLM
jgi:hypothetical protein